MKRLSLLAAIGMLALAVVVPSTVSAAPAQRNTLLSGIPVSGVLSDGGSFVGNLTLTSITRTATGALQFGGSLVGTATSAGVATPVNQTFTAVAGSLTEPDAGKCDILFLDLAPLHLNLLGLEVDLSQVTLDVNAIPGAGNLLGNLLCAVVGLLDGGPATALNNLLRIINNLLG